MTERDSAGLPKDAERLLAGWAATTRDAATLEELTRRTDARCAETAPGSTPDELLAAPLPESASDGSLAAPAGASPDSLPAPRASSPGLAGMSLAALAASVSAQTRPETEADLARESLSLASQSRPSAREIAASLSARRAAPSVPPAPSAQVPASTAAPAQAAPLPAAAASGRSGWLIGGAALLALAAALVLMLGRRAPAPSATAIVLANASAPAASAPPELLEPPDQGAATPSPPGASPIAAAGANAPPTAPRAAAPGEHVVAAKPAGSAGPSDQEPTPEKITLAETPEPANLAPRPAAPAAKEDEPEPGTPAAGESAPEKPSSGDIQAAIASVLGGARACVAGQEAPSKATIVFGSDGRVQSVTVTGPAAGTPSADCIRAALSRARVHRFTRPSFSVGTAIRP